MYSETQVTELLDELATLADKHDELMLGFVARQYRSSKAKEHATHGFSRRLKILKRTVENVFQILPPSRKDIPTRDELSDATINVHAFLFHVFGSLDNLAWTWVHERGVPGNDGNPLAPMKVGLGAKCKEVRASLSDEFRDYLHGMERWFGGMENFRHALAHRIPLYIPPYTIHPEKFDEYQKLESAQAEAVSRLDFAERERLVAAQKELTKFTPMYVHSFDENSPRMVLHAQLLADFNTVHALGQKMIVELRRC